MRHFILKDKDIPLKDFEAWKKEDVAFWKGEIDITPTYEMMEIDYTGYPTYVDSDGDIRPTNAYLQQLTNLVVKKVGELGCDFIMVMIHEDNFRSTGVLWEQLKKQYGIVKEKGIRGTNYSYKFGKQCLDYCQWDKKNPANTFGVAYHERHHSFDALIKVETGVDIEPLLGVVGYDESITHGRKAPWKYIRYRENLKSLVVMKPHLLAAFKKRQERHEEVIKGMMQTIITLAKQVIYLLRMKQNQKDGLNRI